jgi:hypothetical protein
VGLPGDPTAAALRRAAVSAPCPCTVVSTGDADARARARAELERAGKSRTVEDPAALLAAVGELTRAGGV